jgi:alkylation response protein AidB-like acyl-CoA dehydrogenase
LSRLTPELIRMSSMSKCLCADTAMWVTTEAVQVPGGYGYTKEFPVERMKRDAKIAQFCEERTKSNAPLLQGLYRLVGSCCTNHWGMR